jgi:hypothetical protein
MAATVLNRTTNASGQAIAFDPTKLSYRFELISNGFAIASFTLGLPPSNYTKAMRLRASFDKTFGGSALELSRKDNEQIDIKGTFSGVRAHAWLGGKKMSGMDAYKGFRDKILYFTSRKDTPLFNKKAIPRTAIKFYDLYASESSFVHITRFSIDRDASRPYFWNYAISMITIDPPPTDNPLDAFVTLLNDAKGFVDLVGDVVSEYGTVATQMVNQINEAAAVCLNIANSAFDLADTSLQTVTNTLNSITALSTALLSVPLLFLDRVEQVLTNTRGIVTATQDFLSTWDAAFNGEYGGTIAAQIKDIETTAKALGTLSEIEYNKTVDLKVVSPDVATFQSSENTPSNGYSRGKTIELHKVLTGETLEDISMQYYGSREYAAMLANYNRMTTTSVAVGQQLRVPIMEGDIDIYENIVHSRQLDNFGQDAQIAAEKLVVSTTGDINTVHGAQCLIQSLESKFKFSLNELKSDPTFGYDDSQVGARMNIEQLTMVQLKVEECLRSDGRIKAIDNVKLVITDTGTYIEAEATLQNDFILPFNYKVG